MPLASTQGNSYTSRTINILFHWYQVNKYTLLTTAFRCQSHKIDLTYHSNLKITVPSKENDICLIFVPLVINSKGFFTSGFLSFPSCFIYLKIRYNFSCNSRLLLVMFFSIFFRIFLYERKILSEIVKYKHHFDLNSVKPNKSMVFVESL